MQAAAKAARQEMMERVRTNKVARAPGSNAGGGQRSNAKRSAPVARALKVLQNLQAKVRSKPAATHVHHAAMAAKPRAMQAVVKAEAQAASSASHKAKVKAPAKVVPVPAVAHARKMIANPALMPTWVRSLAAR